MTEKVTKAPRGAKTKFVLSLSPELSAKDVVAKGKEQGLTLTEAHVYKIRSTGKATKPKATKGGKTRGAVQRAASSERPSKREFVLSFGPDTGAAEVVKKAKAAGIALSKGYVYVIRSSAGKTGRAKATKPAAGGRGAAGKGGLSSREAQFMDAAIDIGVARATELLGTLRDRFKQLL